jgi:hypothetical protein
MPNLRPYQHVVVVELARAPEMTFEVEEQVGTNYTVELRQDQWDLIVLCLTRIRSLTTGDSQYTVDQLGRQFLRRCVDETVNDIRANVPEHKA